MSLLPMIFGGICSVLVPFVYLCKQRTHFYILHIVIASFAALQYLLVGGIAGMLSRSCSIIKNSVYLFYAGKKQTAPIAFMIVFTLFTLCVTALGFTGWVSILPLLAIVVSSFGNWQEHYVVLCLCNFVAIIFNVIYSLCVGAYAILPAYLVETIAIFIGLIRNNRVGEGD